MRKLFNIFPFARQYIIDALHSSELHLETLDLAFNKITDAGVHVLCKAFASGMALELSTVYLGGNRVSASGMALSQVRTERCTTKMRQILLTARAIALVLMS